jgi:hypothetical protein
VFKKLPSGTVSTVDSAAGLLLFGRPIVFDVEAFFKKSAQHLLMKKIKMSRSNLYILKILIKSVLGTEYLEL